MCPHKGSVHMWLPETVTGNWTLKKTESGDDCEMTSSGFTVALNP